MGDKLENKEGWGSTVWPCERRSEGSPTLKESGIQARGPVGGRPWGWSGWGVYSQDTKEASRAVMYRLVWDELEEWVRDRPSLLRGQPEKGPPSQRTALSNLLQMQELVPTQDLLNYNLHFNKIPRPTIRAWVCGSKLGHVEPFRSWKGILNPFSLPLNVNIKCLSLWEVVLIPRSRWNIPVDDKNALDLNYWIAGSLRWEIISKSSCNLQTSLQHLTHHGEIIRKKHHTVIYWCT